MDPILAHLPAILVLYRLFLGPVLIALSMLGVRGIVFLPLLVSGALSDVLDGIIARRLGVDTPFLRRSDSLADVIFYLCVLAVACIVNTQTMRESLPLIAGMIGLEVACIAASLIRFSTMPATHSYLAKLFGLVLAVTFTALIAFEVTSIIWLSVLTSVSLVANVEVLLIIGRARIPPVDVASVFAMERFR